MKKFRFVSLMLALFSVLALMPSVSLAAGNKPVLYTGQITMIYSGTSGVYPTDTILRPKPSDKKLGTLRPGTKLEIVDIGPGYVEINYKNGTAFVLRKRVDNVVPVDPVNTPPYGVVPFRYYAEMSAETEVKAAPKDSADTLITLQQGAKLAFIDIENGWGKVIFKRQYGYVDTSRLTQLMMVAPSIDEGDDQTPIAVYNSFYNIATNPANQNRMVNLAVCSKRTDRVMKPGELLNFNDSVGPFTAQNGYLPANGLVDGEVVPAMGGGSCQSSSTLYNTVLQLTGLTVTARAPHGNDGAPYLPHGVDASSGDLNFMFRNDYDFPIRIESHVQDGAYFIAIYRVV